MQHVQGIDFQLNKPWSMPSDNHPRETPLSKSLAAESLLAKGQVAVEEDASSFGGFQTSVTFYHDLGSLL